VSANYFTSYHYDKTLEVWTLTSGEEVGDVQMTFGTDGGGGGSGSHNRGVPTAGSHLQTEGSRSRSSTTYVYVSLTCLS
jgi:hypothetical protein